MLFGFWGNKRKVVEVIYGNYSQPEVTHSMIENQPDSGHQLTFRDWEVDQKVVAR